jgi:hypothetical protein
MNTIFRPFATVALAGLVTLAACARKDARRNETSDTAGASASAGTLEGPTRKDSVGGMAGMQGMAGMAGGMMGTGMMDSMQTHMRMMDTVSADHMKTMLPMHRQMVANMLSRMSTEMRSMSMPADPAWSATADSLRQDLAHMPEMSAAELKATMPAHHARMTRLMQMHRDMMARTKS